MLLCPYFVNMIRIAVVSGGLAIIQIKKKKCIFYMIVDQIIT